MEILIHRAEFVPGQSLPLFELGPPVFEGIDFALKRTFDIVGSSLLLILLSPLLLAITLAVRLTSRGPALYRSSRRGIGQRPFACLKFRTMQIDADQRQDGLEELNEADGALFKIREDPRLTPVGGSCAASPSTSFPSWSTCCAARCRWSARGRCPNATTRCSRSGTASATWCYRASPACGRSPAARSSTSTTS